MAGGRSKEYKLAIEIAGKVSSTFNSAIGKAQGTLSKLGSAVGTVAKVSAAAMAAATAAAVAFAKSSIDAGMQFDKSMAQVAATMGTTVDQIGDLRNFAMEMGAKTAFSATEAADALNYMALAGYDAETSMAMLPNVLNLAAAGGMALSDASDMVTDAQSALGLTLDQTSAMVDQMARASSKTNTSVTQLGEAILTVGGTAQYMAGGTAELNSVLGVLADNGIKGSEGGTHLRNILLKLSSPTKDATALLNRLGVQVFDTEGNMRSFADIFPELNAAMSSMTDQERLDAMATLFNSRDIASATALLSTTTERWSELGDTLADCSGAADQMAKTQLDNLAGDITLWKSALEGAQITLSDQLTPSLREFVQFGTAGVSELSDAFKEGGLSGAMGALGGIISDGLNMVVAAAPQAMNAGLQLLGALGQGMIDNLPTITDTAITLTLMFAQGIIGALPSVGTAAVQIATSLVSGIQAHMPEILVMGSDLLGALYDGIMTGLPMAAQGAKTIMVNLGTYLKENLPSLLQAGLEALVQLTGSIRENAGVLVDGALSLAVSLAQGLAAGIPTIIQNVPLIVSNIANTINDNAPKILGAALNIIVTLAGGLVSAIPTLIACIPRIIAAIWDTITAVNWISLGGTVVTAIGNGIRGMAISAVEAVGSLGTAMKNGLSNLPQAFANIGRNIIQGLINGAKSMVTGVIGNIKSIGTSILSTFKSIFKINSPSKETGWVGEMLVAGLANSIEDNSGEAVKAAAGLAGNINGVMHSIAGNAQADITASLNTDALQLPPAIGGSQGEAAASMANTLDAAGSGSLANDLLRDLDSPDKPDGNGGSGGGEGGGGIYITYAPQYHFEGEAPTREDMVEAGRMSQAEFDEHMRQWEKDRSRKGF